MTNFDKGSGAFKQIVDALENIGDLILSDSDTSKAVTNESLVEWHRQYIFDILKGWRYGQSFCEFYGVSKASPLYWFGDTDICQRWIKNRYFRPGVKWPEEQV